MAGLDFLNMRKLAAEEVVRRTTEANGVMLKIKHVGTGSTQAPTVVLSNTSTTLTLVDAAAATTTIDLSAAATDTIGELADYINSLSSWKCKIMDALRSDSSNDVFTNGTVTATVKDGETVFELLALIATATLVARATFDPSVDSGKPKGSHRVTLNGFDTYATTTGGANTIKIYDCDVNTKSETQIWGGLGVNNTLLTYSSSSSSYPFHPITAKENHELVVVIAGTVTTAPTTNYLQIYFTRE